MTTMGLYEVRAHLSELVDQVAKRKKVLITLPPPCLVRLLRRAGRMCAKSSRRCWQFGTARDRRWAASLPFGSQSTKGAASRSTRDKEEAVWKCNSPQTKRRLSAEPSRAGAFNARKLL